MAALRCCLLILMALGLVIFAGSLTMYFIFPNMISAKIKEALPLRNGSASLKKWEKVTVPIYFRIYLFHVKNPEDVEARGAIPILEERGPYTFHETREKHLRDIIDNGEVLEYHDIKKFYFDENLSYGSLDDTIEGMIQKLKAKEKDMSVMGNLIGGMLSSVISSTGEKVIIKRTVRELLFDGYRVKVLDEVSNFLSNFGVTMPQTLPNNTFGVMYNKNGTTQGLYSINSGIKDITQLGKVQTFRNRPTVPHWKGESCNMINGTDGSAFHPTVSRSESLYLFNTDLCRSLYLDYEHDSEVLGIPTYKYSVPARFFGSPAKEPENQCFCTQPEGLEAPLCQIDGILDISTCKGGAPIILSAPHFYQGDRELRYNVSGLDPHKDKHETLLEVEPYTGLVLNARRRIQINVNVKRFSDMPIVANVNNMIMPLLWLEEAATADEKSADLFKSRIRNKLVLGNAVIIGGMTIGLAMFLIALGYYVLRIHREDSDERKRRAAEIFSPDEYKSLPQKESAISYE